MDSTQILIPKGENVVVNCNKMQLKLELENKATEIQEKYDIIRSLEDEDKSTAEESDAEDSDDEEEDQTEKFDRNEASGKVTSDNEGESEGEFDFFQLEVVIDKEVYVCNLFDEGLDSEAEVKGTPKKKHKKELKFY